MINQLIASFVLIVLILENTVIGVKFYDIQDDEIDQLLKKLNKPALKSIQSPDGDIIDCVHMKNHPIYDHPLFKNHTIQMKPSIHLEGWKKEPSNEDRKSLVTQLWTTSGQCPKNSISIIRTKREDILRAKSIKRYGKKDLNNIRQLKRDNGTHEYAVVRLQGIFNGAQGIINVWKPFVQIPKEFSLAQIWLVAGSRGERNTIEFGWQVYPSRNNGTYPKFFSYWTVDNYKKTGCYDLKCPGFVLVSRNFTLGGAVSNISILNGTQYDFSTKITKDPSTGNYWLSVNDSLIGYWPSLLFTHLRTGATTIDFGGEILSYNFDGQHTTTKMGSGNFAGEGYKKAAYFRNLQIFDQQNSWKPIQDARGGLFQTKATCYNVMSYYYENWGNYFYYGGPGRNQHCS